jgi:RNA polymerase sigma factor (sigma-70 family)
VRVRLGAALRRRVESEDVLQEVLLEAAQLFLEKNLAASLKDQEFFPWLSKIIEHKIKNLARFHVAAKKRAVDREVPLQGAGPLAQPSEAKSPSAEILEEERAHRLRKAIASLPGREREVVTLVHLEKLRVSEAARRMGKTANATSVLLHQALERLEAILKRKEP